MRNIVGTPVVGDDFYGRDEEISYAWNLIETGNNRIFPSPRRVGKTSFAFKLLDIAKDKKWNILALNLEESASNDLDFLEVFIKKLQGFSFWDKVKAKGSGLLDFISGLKPSIGVGGVDAKLEWERNRESVYNQVSQLLPHDENTLIFFDEITVLLNKILKSDGKERVTNFLHWLRGLRQVKGSKVRWIFCSSVGIENFTHLHNISDAVNDMPDFVLKSYSKEKSKSMLIKLGIDNNLELTDDIRTGIVDKLEYCLPYFVQIFFEKIKYLSGVEAIPIDKKIVDIAYDALIEEKHFNTWIERINEQYGDNAFFAFGSLKQLCQKKDGMDRSSIINTIAALGANAEKVDEISSLILYMLKNDGYMIEENSRYRFLSPLLRDFWFNRFVK